jgi:HK97 family phage prohead protease
MTVPIRPDNSGEFRTRLAELRRDCGVVEKTAGKKLAAARLRAQTGTFEQRSTARSARHGVRETRPCRVSAPNLEWEVRNVPNGTGGTDMEFTGFGCVTEVQYEMQDQFGPYGELVEAGAFDVTLRNAADVSFLLNHQGMSLARTKSGTLKLSAVKVGSPTGLHVEARLDTANATVREIRSAIERGDLDEMSFGFRTVRQTWDADYTQRTLQEVNLNQGDVSIVNYAANPFTAGTVGVRGKQSAPVALKRPQRDYTKVVAKMRKG